MAKLHLQPGSEIQPGLLDLSGQSEEMGSNENQIDASIEGKDQLIAFNVQFLREVLDVIKTPNVILETTSETNPGVLRPVGDENFVHVIMPMHLGG
ncbi:MAG: hypothetical protein ACPL4H_11480 [Anaerolineales bacterium]